MESLKERLVRVVEDACTEYSVVGSRIIFDTIDDFWHFCLILPSYILNVEQLTENIMPSFTTDLKVCLDIDDIEFWVGIEWDEGEEVPLQYKRQINIAK